MKNVIILLCSGVIIVLILSFCGRAVASSMRPADAQRIGILDEANHYVPFTGIGKDGQVFYDNRLIVKFMQDTQEKDYVYDEKKNQFIEFVDSAPEQAPEEYTHDWKGNQVFIYCNSELKHTLLLDKEPVRTIYVDYSNTKQYV